MSRSATSAPPAGRGRRTPVMDRTTAMRLAATEYTRLLESVRDLSAADWERPTSCPEWDVHAMVCHVLGMAQMSATPRETIRQLRAARRAANRSGALFIDALTELQVAEHITMTPSEVIDALAIAGPAAARGRQRTPAAIRWLPAGEQLIDETTGLTETWSLGYLLDVILTRDPWMHRADIAAATGQPMQLSGEHDGTLVADVAAEWAARHAEPCTLTLTGPAGGQWSWGGGGESIELDAVEFCRTLSGRSAGSGLLATRVPF